MDKDEIIRREKIAKDYRLTMGDLKKLIEYYDDDCVINFSTTEGEEFYNRIKIRGTDESDIKPDGNEKVTLVTFELGTLFD